MKNISQTTIRQFLRTAAVALALGDESRAFVTAEADEKGNRVWTDIYRSGKVVLITQVLSAGDSAEDLREAIARKVI